MKWAAGLINRIRHYLRETLRQGTELLWAKKWEDTKRGIKWIEDMPGISPCGAAVGYNYLYIMTRILYYINHET